MTKFFFVDGRLDIQLYEDQSPEGNMDLSLLSSLSSLSSLHNANAGTSTATVVIAGEH